MRNGTLLGLCALVFALTAQGAAAEACKPLTLISSIDMVQTTDALLVPVQINGHEKTMVLDTGRVYESITPSVVKELGLQTSRRAFLIYDVTGASSDRITKIDRFQIGTLMGRNVTFVVSPSDLPDRRFAGFIAPDMLQNYDVELDFVTRKVNLLSQDHCPGKVIYWPARTVAIAPIRVVESGHIIIPVTLDGHEMEALLDTGTARSTLSMREAQAVFGLGPTSPGVAEEQDGMNGDRTLKSYRYRFHTLSIEGVAITNPEIGLIADRMRNHLHRDPPTGTHISANDEPDHLPDFLLGLTELSRLHLYIAYGEQKLYVTAADNGAADTPTPAQTAADAQ